jgi:hypothetical protein
MNDLWKAKSPLCFQECFVTTTKVFLLSLVQQVDNQLIAWETRFGFLLARKWTLVTWSCMDEQLLIQYSFKKSITGRAELSLHVSTFWSQSIIVIGKEFSTKSQVTLVLHHIAGAKSSQKSLRWHWSSYSWCLGLSCTHQHVCLVEKTEHTMQNISVSHLKHDHTHWTQLNDFTKRKDTKLLYLSPLMYGWTAARSTNPHQ